MIATEMVKSAHIPKIERLRQVLESIIRGKADVIDQLLLALLAGGSVLLEDVPGVGKTTLAKALAAVLELEFQRVQCTPDLLPADIFGFSVFNPQDGTFHFRSGPVFCHVLLVDEINRASPRTQSALLEAMAEGQVTIEGVRRPLPTPFMVIATQNPLGARGTFPLPESQLDRFLLHLSMGYPDAESETAMLFDQRQEHPAANLAAMLTREELVACHQEVREVHVERNVGEYITKIVRQTRHDPRIKIGCSPRGALMLFRAAQAAAYLESRDFVLPDDVQRMAVTVIPHRLVPVKAADPTTLRRWIEEIVEQIDVPT